jgi:RimJ/RimL family protein N-acetyltransferase
VPVVLSPFSEGHAAEVAAWLLSEKEARAWAGHEATFPLSPDQFRRWHDEPDVHPFIGRMADVAVAYGELWVDYAEREVELARIIVHPTHRGVGIGRAFVKALVDRAGNFGLSHRFIRVLPDNEPAIRCYQCAGFVPVSTDDQKNYNQGQPYNYVWLRHAL